MQFPERFSVRETAPIIPEAAAAPDWSQVPFDVGCARCGHDLRGRTEPVCPACDLTFDWADAVPLEELVCEQCGYHLLGLREKRCPECGSRFTWEEAIAARERRKRPLFEYHWRQHAVRSFLKSVRFALQPRRLWKQLDIHDNPPVPALLGLAVLSLVATLGVMHLASTIVEWVYSTPWVKTQGVGWTMGRPRISDLPGAFTRVFSGTLFSSLVVLVWCASSFLSLLIFRRSMRLCRVRVAHVARVWTYAHPVLLAGISVAIAAWAVLHSAAHAWHSALGIPESTVRIVGHCSIYGFAVGSFAYLVWSIRCGYRHYMRMRHAFWVGLSAQTIAVLVTMMVLCMPRGWRF